MTIYNWISLSISAISLIISASVAYLAYFKKAKSKILVGSNLILFNSFENTISGKAWGGVTLLLPITFYNWSPQGGYVYEVRVIVGQKHNPNDYFDMAWTNFVKFVDGINWDNEDTAQPVAIPGRTSLSKFIRFDWSPLRGEKLKINNGQYELILIAWSSKSDKPDIKEKFEFTVTDEMRSIFQKTIDNNDSFGLWIPIDDTRRSNNVRTRTGITREYQI